LQKSFHLTCTLQSCLHSLEVFTPPPPPGYVVKGELGG